MKPKSGIFFDQPQLPFEEFREENERAAAGKGVHMPPRDTSPDEMAIQPDTPRIPLHYISLASGSSGNSCYIGTDRGGIIIDAGIRADEIEDKLAANGIRMKDVKALLLTHDHSDHVRYAYQLLRSNRNMSLMCTPRVLAGMLRRHNISRAIRDYHTPIFKEIPFKVGRMEITAFDVSHDGSDNMGFHILFGPHTFVLATDLGEVGERAEHYMRQANYLVIEANYDADMLRLGRYPAYLKARICAANGHLDNLQTAAFLRGIVRGSDLSHIFLCHLSKDNNTPAKALKAVRDALEAEGLRVGNANESIDDRKADIQLMALPRYEATRRFTFFR